MTKSIKYLIVTCLIFATILGCKKSVNEPDTTKPTISIIKPISGQAFVPGNTVTFQATFSDNDKLKNYEIAISKVTLGGFILKNIPTPVAWIYSKPSTNFSSGVKQQEINLSDIVIPMDINGNPVEKGKYNFKVTVFDVSLNRYETTVEININ